MSNDNITAVTITREASCPGFSVTYVYHTKDNGDSEPQTVSGSTPERLVRRLEAVIGWGFNYILWQLSPATIEEFKRIVNAAPGTSVRLERAKSLHYIQQRQM